MAISKKDREIIKNKYNGKCAYSGTLLQDDWQIDHIIPKCCFRYASDGNPDDINNLVPCQKIINHYKRSLTLEQFRNWYLGGLHERLKKLPKNPKVAKSINRKIYLQNIATLFDISETKPFNRKFYFECF